MRLKIKQGVSALTSEVECEKVNPMMVWMRPTSSICPRCRKTDSYVLVIAMKDQDFRKYHDPRGIIKRDKIISRPPRRLTVNTVKKTEDFPEEMP